MSARGKKDPPSPKAAAPEAPAKPKPPMPAGLKKKWAAGSFAKQSDRKTIRLTELRNAERLIEHHGDSLRYVGAWRTWLVWDGKCWAPDTTGRALQLAADTMRKLAAEAEAEVVRARQDLQNAGDLAAKTKAEALMKAAREYREWIASSQNHRRLMSTLAVAAAMPAVAVTTAQLDADPWVFACQNGVVDLKTGKFRPHSRKDLITKLAGTTYDPKAKAPTWGKFLEVVMRGDSDLLRYLQKLAGYALTGQIREHLCVFFYGKGANGKSTYLNTLEACWGGYAGRGAQGTLMRTKNDRHPTSIAALFGKRLVMMPEIDEDQEWDDGQLKTVTGGDPITARFMGKDEFTYIPSHKLFIAGNSKPRVKGTSYGIWRRMRLVPWLATITEVDTELPEKLKKELPGILNWCLRGCALWQKEGLEPPAAVVAATNSYRVEQDTLGHFIRERVVVDQAARVPRADLYEVYKDWCEELGVGRMGHRKMAEALRDVGAVEINLRVKDNTGTEKFVNGWAGVRLMTSADVARAEARAAAENKGFRVVQGGEKPLRVAVKRPPEKRETSSRATPKRKTP